MRKHTLHRRWHATVDILYVIKTCKVEIEADGRWSWFAVNWKNTKNMSSASHSLFVPLFFCFYCFVLQIRSARLVYHFTMVSIVIGTAGVWDTSPHRHTIVLPFLFSFISFSLFRLHFAGKCWVYCKLNSPKSRDFIPETDARHTFKQRSSSGVPFHISVLFDFIWISERSASVCDTRHVVIQPICVDVRRQST